jgi:hypothetical protein
VAARDAVELEGMPEGWTAVEVPTELFEHVTKDGLKSGEIKRFNEPIKVLTGQGTIVLWGPGMHDPGGLSQMHMPDYETCIEVPRSSITALLEVHSRPDHSRAA